MFGINPRGICTFVSTINNAVPIPVATTSLMPNLFFIMFSFRCLQGSFYSGLLVYSRVSSYIISYEVRFFNIQFREFEAELYAKHINNYILISSPLVSKNPLFWLYKLKQIKIDFTYRFGKSFGARSFMCTDIRVFTIE